MIGSKLRFYFGFEILPCRSHKQKTVWPCPRTSTGTIIKCLAVPVCNSLKQIMEERMLKETVKRNYVEVNYKLEISDVLLIGYDINRNIN